MLQRQIVCTFSIGRFGENVINYRTNALPRGLKSIEYENFTNYIYVYHFRTVVN